jgi:ribonuclease HII
MAAAVILDPMRPIEGLADSKRLAPRRRLHLAAEIERSSLAWAVASATVEEIDRLNILQASLLAMQRAIETLAPVPQRVLVDGNRCPRVGVTAQAIVGGDACVPAISAASILAKVARDREMERLDGLFPGYGFARHKGYPTREHLAALQAQGPTAIHRRSFRPVRERLGTEPGAFGACLPQGSGVLDVGGEDGGLALPRKDREPRRLP